MIDLRRMTKALALALLMPCLAQAAETAPSATDLFKYGSIGADGLIAVPYRFWLVMPKVCQELLPDRGKQGYENFGWMYEPGHALPIGVSSTEHSVIGRTVGINCAACHTSTIRRFPGDEPRMILGMPAHKLDLIASNTFLSSCIQDEKRFTRERVIEAWESGFEKADRDEYLKTHPAYDLPRWIAANELWKKTFWAEVPVFRSQLKTIMAKLNLFFDVQPPHGFGRDDSTNLYKVLFLGQTQIPSDEIIGNVEFMSIWNGKLRHGTWSHWDGSVRNRIDRDLLVSIGASGNKYTLPLARGYLRKRLANLERIEDWLSDLDAPAYPLPVRTELLARGESAYTRNCASCHGTREQRYGAQPIDYASTKETRVGRVIPRSEIGTDPSRNMALTPELGKGLDRLIRFVETPKPRGLDAYTAQGEAIVRSTDGYVAPILDGIYLRGPYLHNGSVPTIADLLRAPSNRPVTFYRGSDLLDVKRVGFVSEASELQASGERLDRLQVYDTRLRGNGNQGHAYGTDLSDEDREALLEYLKTF